MTNFTARKALFAGALFMGLFAGTPAMAAEEGAGLRQSGTDLTDRASLQRGAALFMNYCSRTT
jgi:ubiquinol-cytochrome c reductase cytochrome c1 subunit